MSIRRLSALFLCAALMLCAFSGCNADKKPLVQTETYYDFFDTVTLVISYAEDSPEVFNANASAVSSLFSEYHKLFDIYHTYSGINNLKTVNDSAGKAPVKVDKRLIDFLIYAKEIYTLTNGATNVAMGSVLSLWHRERELYAEDPSKASVPSSDSLSKASKHTDISSIVIDEETETVYISDPDVRIDVGALGKGYATERAAELLVSRGVTSYVLNVGGNLRAIGQKPNGEGFITGITDPDKKDGGDFICKVNLKNSSLVTSGNYERYYTVGEKSYHHIIDPKTNMPAEFFSSVSVFTSDSGLADALSTALFCMNYEDGKALVSAVGSTEVIWVTLDGKLLYTQGVDFYSK